ncbi:hypothetical protein HZB60_04140 [candidate division KSB1 bacterium]|nr:hypothetical protein [candidate division KSB1 bacterium]
MKYQVKSPILHNGKRVEPGKTLDLDEKEAGPLVRLGCLESLSEKKDR